ncbi:hypothetical protein M9H77_27502 [Catharanthus roseus]|uniref:Uncharacterized protein n=1 Tax=Catharanthus roseus TaxID=4058 RepID=A0ACC0AEU3_CATRO|nr:hypothetical protein M9H77_27502 [Catharanthus roseus]
MNSSEQKYNQGECELFEIEANQEPLEVRKVEIQPQQVDEPKVGSFYNNIDDLFDSYLMYAKSRGFSIAKKYGSKGNGCSFRKYHTITCDRGRKLTGNKYSERIECPALLSAILRDNSNCIKKIFSSKSGRPWSNRLRAANKSSRRNKRRASQNGSRSQSHKTNVPTTVQREEEIHEENMGLTQLSCFEYSQSIVQLVEMKLQHHLTI